MKYILPLIFLSGATLTAQGDSLDFPFIAYWSKGDIYHFEVSKIESQYKDGELLTTDTSRYRSTFEVLDSTADSYRIRYQSEDQNMMDQLSEEMLSVIEKYNHLPDLIYLTDEYGVFQGIENWPEYAAMMREMFDAFILDEAGKEGVDTAALRLALGPTINVFATQNGFMQKVVAELTYMHYPYGSLYTAYDTLRYLDTVSNLFGGRPIGIENVVYVEEFDKADDYVEIRHLTDLTPDGEEAMLELIASSMPGISDTETMAAFLASATLRLEDDNWYAYYNNPGIPIMIENDRYFTLTSSEGEHLRHDKLVVEWVD